MSGPLATRLILIGIITLFVVVTGLAVRGCESVRMDAQTVTDDQPTTTEAPTTTIAPTTTTVMPIPTTVPTTTTTIRRVATTTTSEPEQRNTATNSALDPFGKPWPSPADADWGIWQRMARCETGGNWQMRGKTFSGGVGFANTTFSAYGGNILGIANAADATIEQQIWVARRVRDRHGYSGWGCAPAIGVG